MDSELEDDSEKLGKAIPMLSDYVKALETETRVKEQYLAKISAIGVDLASIPKEQFNVECHLPTSHRSSGFAWIFGSGNKPSHSFYEQRIQGVQKFERL